MSPSNRGDDSRDEPTGGDDPQFKYIAPMPAPRPRDPEPDEDSTAGYAVASREPAPYVRPSSATPGAASPQQPAPVMAGSGSTAAKGGWLAPMAVILVSLAALAAVYFLTLGSDGSRRAAPTGLPSPVASSPQETGEQGPSPTESDDSSGTEATAPSSETTPAEEPSPSSSSPSPSSSRASTPATLPAGVKVCGPKIGAGATTTCGFAKNVAAAVGQARPDTGAFSVGAWSPTTKKNYRLSCTDAPVTICTGGRAAVIYVAR